MSEDNQQQNQTETVESLRAKISELEAENKQLRDRIAELEAENEKLRQTLEKGAAALESEIEEQKAAAKKAITEKTNFSKSELEKMKLPALRLILKTIDSAKDYEKWLKQAEIQDLAWALKRLAQLNQTKAYLLWDNSPA